MTERTRKLRQQSLDARPSITPERAALATAFYRDSGNSCLPPPILRARLFSHLLENKEICINPGELIVGERGPAPKATPTYPEICAHSLEDLQILDSRPKTPYAVDAGTLALYRDRVLPFWRGRSMRDRIFAAMTPEWKDCFEAGIFTEFMEQRAPGHSVMGDKIYRRGFLDFKEEIAASLRGHELSEDPRAVRKRDELTAMSLCCDAIVSYARRHAARARGLAAEETDGLRRAELEGVAEVCDHVPAHAPRSFHEALQAYWFVHLGVIMELNTWDSFNPGRLDQHLYPFYRKGLEDGSLTRDSARELLEAFWVKFNNQPAPPKVGVTAAESGTYADFALINIGGLTPGGDDAVNELSYLILDVVEEMRLIQPSAMVQLSVRNPDAFLTRALKVVKAGFGQPSLFNTDAMIAEMLRQGKSPEDARAGGASGCVETAAFGRENHNLTGYFNLTKVLEITLADGVDPRTGKRLGPSTGDPRAFGSYDELFGAFGRQLAHFISVKMRGNDVIERLFADTMPAPYLSVLIDDCIATASDYHEGGARYNSSYIMAVGLGTVTDCLAALRTNVFERHTVGMGELLEALAADFRGREDLRLLLVNRSPKYGNDDEAADGEMRRVFEAYYGTIEGRANAKGGSYHVSFFPTTCHVYFGSVVGATPDGRRAGQPLSEGISPVQGRDRRGPTAVVSSAAKLDHVRTGGTLLNQKISPPLLADEDGITKLAHLVRGYFSLMGHHIQFNVVSADTLRRARARPEAHRDLIVRVAGYSDYFVDLGEALQEEIIQRTEQTAL